MTETAQQWLDRNFRPGNPTGIERSQITSLTITRSRVNETIGWIISWLVGSSKTEVTLANQLEGNLNLNGFTNLKTLECQNNQLTDLDVSGLNQLQTLYCQNNLLTSLNVSGNANLRILYCFGNPNLRIITGLESLTSLRRIDCGNINDPNANNRPHVDLRPINQLREQVRKVFLIGADDKIGNNHNIGYKDLIDKEIVACQEVMNASQEVNIPQDQRDQAQQEEAAYQAKILQITPWRN